MLYGRTAGQCEYLFGDTVTALRDTGEGVHVEFRNAPARVFDLVVGCDGIHSRVRKLAFGPEADFVTHDSYYYAIAGASAWQDMPEGNRQRARSLGCNAPGRFAMTGGNKAAQMYLFASPALDYSRDDFDQQRAIIAERFAGMGWEVPRMLAELPYLDDFYLDAIAKVRMKNFTSGRVALLGDSAWGHALNGFGTGSAIVGAYVLAGELAAADGDYTVAYASYEEIMKRLLRKTDEAAPGRFLAPRTARGLRFRRFVRSRGFKMMAKYAENTKNDIDLKHYPEPAAN
ncbi:FAD-dependent monooxygenase [Nocardia seriolae]|uniref:FAD-dependent monooxygenase n=1 Tax=Nocardia seriolae TaxID=37332 RepID=UPI0022AB1855|nr:FAD-dependent monooxygenase [Nocardia seriolae]WKY56043.1 FAD-dependent monooxygenase [Nocardia seriolae]